MVLNNFIKAACLSTCLGLASGSVLGNNYNIDTNGGLSVYDRSNNDHWFQLNGKIKFDQTVLHASKEGTISTFASLRAVKASLSGGLGNNTSYKLKLSNGSNGLSVDSASINYSGLNDWSSVTIGDVEGLYGLEKSSDSNFLETSLATDMFVPSAGLGIKLQAWTDRIGLAFAMTQPGSNVTSMEELSYSTRVTFAPVNADDFVLHLGLSAAYSQAQDKNENDQSTNMTFKSHLEVKGRDMNQVATTGKVSATSETKFCIDAALQKGPALLQAEYHRSAIAKDKGDSVNFYGYNVQASYALGESRQYNYRTGGFQSMDMAGDWEFSLRHSFINLDGTKNDTAHAYSVGGSVSWTATDNVQLLANYVHTPLTAVGSDTIDNLGAFAFRVQASW
jgi:phosphate-selective porin